MSNTNSRFEKSAHQYTITYTTLCFKWDKFLAEIFGNLTFNNTALNKSKLISLYYFNTASNNLILNLHLLHKN